MKIRKIYLSQKTDVESYCDNISVRFDIPQDSCAGIKCEAKKEGEYWTIILQYPDDCNDCIYAIVTCEDECDICDNQQRIKICPCETDSDCEDCSICNEDGVCVTVCEEGEFCDDDECVECNDEFPCPGGKICDNGVCVCPPGLKENSKGECVECFIGEELPNCQRCIDGVIVERECDDPDLYIDPDTCLCVECYNNVHCQGDNECCGDDNECECCEGYVRDENGDCVEEPECTYDEDCDECEECDLNGNCIERIPPAGYECIDGKDKKICDCENPDCDADEFCLDTVGSENCHCNSCEGECDENTDCGDNCFCDNGICRENPCSGDCLNEDCGPGCGCDPNDFKCYPCDSFDCDICDIVDGCDCGNGDICSDDKEDDDECSGNCETALDCRGDDCGCMNEECIECDKVACDESKDCPHGCICDKGIRRCKKNPCDNVNCINGDDCGEGCGCNEDGICEPCEELDCNGECESVDGCGCSGNDCLEEEDDDDCEDILEIEKGECDLTFTSQPSDCCPCDTIGIGFTVNPGNDPQIFSFEIELRKGNFSDVTGFSANPLLSNTGIANELPLTGVVRIVKRVLYAELGPDEIFTGYRFYEDTEETSINLSGVDTAVSGSIQRPLIDYIAIKGNKRYKIISVEYLYETKIDFKFENDCRYSKGLTRIFFYNMYVPYREFAYGTGTADKLFKKVNCRKPILNLYRSDSSLVIDPNNIFERRYDNVYTLNEYNDGLEPFKYYGLSDDCNCKDPVVYDCNDDDIADPLVFCDPTRFSYELTNCGTSIRFTEDVLITCNAYTDSPVKPNYELKLNGIIADTRVLPSTNILYTQGEEIALGDIINTVTLSIVEDECDDCDIEYTTEYEALDAEILFDNIYCDSQAVLNFDVLVRGGKPNYTVEVVFDPNGTNTTIHSETDILAGIYPFTANTADTGSGLYRVTVTDSEGCIYTEDFNYTLPQADDAIEVLTDCENMSITVVNTSNTRINVVLAGNQGKTLLPFRNHTFSNLDPGSYDVEYTINDECTGIITAELDCCKSVADVTIYPRRSGSDVEFLIQNDSSGKVEVAFTNDSSVTEVIQVNANQGAISMTFDASIGVTATVQSLDGNSCPIDTDYYEYNPEDLCDGFNITITQYCDGLQAQYEILNPFGIDIEVLYDNDPTPVYTGTGNYNGNASQGVHSVTVRDANNNACTTTKVINFNCCIEESIEIVSQNCVGGQLTVEFNYITSASQNGNNIPVANNTVTFDPTLGALTVNYNGQGCNKTENFDLECCNYEDILLVDKECLAETQYRLTFNYIDKWICGGIEHTATSNTIDIDIDCYNVGQEYIDVFYSEPGCGEVSRRFYDAELRCCACEDTQNEQGLSSSNETNLFNFLNSVPGVGNFTGYITIGGQIYSKDMSYEGGIAGIVWELNQWYGTLVNYASVTHENGVYIRLRNCEKVSQIRFDFPGFPSETYPIICKNFNI